MTVERVGPENEERVVEFELLGSMAVPVGFSPDLDEPTMLELVSTLINFPYLRRVVLPGIGESDVDRLKKALPLCEVFNEISHANSYTSRIRIEASAAHDTKPN